MLRFAAEGADLPEFKERDEALMVAVGKGDLNAFEQIVQRHQTWVWRIAVRFLGNEDEASDIAQESFLRLLDAAGRYRPTAKFRTYFYQIISRLCLDCAKKKQPSTLGVIPDMIDPGPNAADQMVKEEQGARVRAALRSLAPNQRLAIVLRYYEDLNYKEIAAAMQTTTRAVERLLARGRERLRMILGEKNDFNDS